MLKNYYIKLSIFFLLIISLALFVYYHANTHKIVMSYFVPDDIKSDYHEFQEKLKKVNVLAYAFLQVNPEGRIIFTEDDLNNSPDNTLFCKTYHVICSKLSTSIGYFDFFSNLTSPSSLKKIISFGGADDRTSFYYATQNINTFVNAVNAIIHQFHLDGIDLDFELNRPYQPEEARLFTNLILTLRNKLGTKPLISIALLSDPETLSSISLEEWQQIKESINYLSVMCYDFIAPKSFPNYTGIASNLYLIENSPKQFPNAYLSCDVSIQHLLTLGIPPTKILLGTPAYGIVYGGVDATENGLYQSFNSQNPPMLDDMGPGLVRYSTIVQLYEDGFEKHFLTSNDYVNGVWAYHVHKQLFITYDSPDSIHAKVSYVLNNNLAGMMIWRIGQDTPISDNLSLLSAMTENLP